MVYGASGTTKTTQCYHIVKWVLSKPGNEKKRFRVLHSDGGGYAPFEDSGMIERKQVELFDFSTTKSALRDFRYLQQGYWPRKVKGGGVYFRKDEKCLTQDWENIAGYIVEGITSTAEVLKTYCSNREEGVGFKESIHFEDDGEHISGLTQGHYDLIQKEIFSAHTTGFKTLPVDWLIYTGLLGKGEDKQRRETVFGPQVVGNALTPRVPSWFMDCFHMDTATWKMGDTEKSGLVAWFTTHADLTTQIPCLAKTSVLPQVYAELLKAFPYGFIPIGLSRGLDLYYEKLEEMKEKFNA